MMILKIFIIGLIINCAVSVDTDPLRSVVEKESLSTYNSRSFRNALNQQSLHTILQSIEERLRNLDQVYSMRCVSSTSTEQYTRKIDLLESKITRLETMLDAQMTKISENMSSKNFKDDMFRDQIFRKIDSVYDRLNHKITYVEGKIDMDLFKMVSKIELSVTKIDRLDHSVSVRQADMETTISDGMNKIEVIKNEINKVENRITNITKNNFEKSQEQQMIIIDNLINVTNKVDNFQEHINHTLRNLEHNILKNETKIIKHIENSDEKINNFGSKLSNMYNELWKKLEKNENFLSINEMNTNFTRKEIQNSLNNIIKKLETTTHQNDKQNDDITNILQKKILELSREMDKQFDGIILNQQLFLESCYRIQSQEQQLETKLFEVLEKIYNSFVNSTNNIEDLINIHHDQIYYQTNQLSSVVLRLANKTSEDRKKIEKTIANVKEDIGKYLASFKQNLNYNSNEYIKKLQHIINVLQEIQELNDHENKINNNKTESTIQELVSKLQTNEFINNITEIFYNSMNEFKCKSNTTEIKPNFGRNIKKEVINEIKSNVNKTYDNNNLPKYLPNSSGDIIYVRNDPNIQEDEESDLEIDEFDDTEDREHYDDIIDYNDEIDDNEQRDEEIIEDKYIENFYTNITENLNETNNKNENINMNIDESINKNIDINLNKKIDGNDIKHKNFNELINNRNSSMDELNDDPEKVDVHIKVLSDKTEKIVNINRYNYTTLNDDYNLTSISSHFKGILDFLKVFSTKNSTHNQNNEIVNDENYVKINSSTYNMTDYFQAKNSEVIYSNDEEIIDMTENPNGLGGFNTEDQNYDTELDENN